MPMGRHEDPSRQLKRATGANHTRQRARSARCHSSSRAPFRQQLDSQKEESVRKDEAAQPGHSAGVQVLGTSLNASKLKAAHRRGAVGATLLNNPLIDSRAEPVDGGEELVSPAVIWSPGDWLELEEQARISGSRQQPPLHRIQELTPVAG